MTYPHPSAPSRIEWTRTDKWHMRSTDNRWTIAKAPQGGQYELYLGLAWKGIYKTAQDAMDKADMEDVE